MEQWKDIFGWAGMYQVSTKGRVRRIMDFTYAVDDQMNADAKILNLSNGKFGPRVRLSLSSKAGTYTVSRLVAEAFIPNPDNLPYVRFKDGNPFNVNVDNLYWSDRFEI